MQYANYYQRLSLGLLFLAQPQNSNSLINPINNKYVHVIMIPTRVLAIKKFQSYIQAITNLNCERI